MFNRVSKWNKFDLHIHTRASKIKKQNSEYFGEGVSFNDDEAKKFVNKIFCTNGPKLIAITDHDVFDNEQFLRIKNEVKLLSDSEKEDLCVLPGVECDCYFKVNKNKKINLSGVIGEKGCQKSDRTQIVVIFKDDNWNEEDYKTLHDIIEELYKTDEPVYIGDILSKFVLERFEFIVVPHFSKKNGIERTLPDSYNGNRNEENMIQKTRWFLSGYFPLLDAKSKDFINLKETEIYNNINEKLDHEVPLIFTSDNHDYRSYSSNIKLSWFKALPTFNGLMMCCSDYEMRVRLNPEQPRVSYISKIDIKNIGDNDVVADSTIFLSDNLNCVIGGRSSGKSLLLKKIVNKANSNKAVEELKEYKKYSSKFSVNLYDQDGKEYKGDVEYISQGEIISKYIGNEGIGIINDFKEYFPKSVNFDFVQKQKSTIIESINKINNLFVKISELSENLRNKNSFDYLKINKIPFKNTISSSTLSNSVDNAQKLLNNLSTFILEAKKNKQLISNFPKVSSKTDELILMASETLDKCNKNLENIILLKMHVIV